LRDWLRWRQDARAATDAGLPTCVPLGHVLLLHAWTSSQLAGPLVAALLALQKTNNPGELLRFVRRGSQVRDAPPSETTG
jgi:hypothetical protein